MSEVHEFTSQLKAQAFVKSLIRKGLEPGLDFKVYTIQVGQYGKATEYRVEVYRKFGLFGA